MNELLTEITQPANMLATGLLALVVLYWLLVIVGAVGMDAFDFDLDADVDLDGDADFEAADSIFGTLFAFFHVGQVPLMLVVSFFALFFWLATVCTNHYLNPELKLLTTAMWLVPCLIVGAAFTKLSVMPIAKLMRSDNRRWDRNELIGKTATVNTLKLDSQSGEIVMETSGPPTVLNARNQTGQTLRKGEIVRIVAHDTENDICLVELAKLETR